MDLEVARADRRLDARLRPRPPPRAPARPPTRWRRRSAARAARAAAARSSTPPHRLRLERARPQPLQLARAGPGDRRRPPRRVSSTSPGAVPASPSERAPSGSDACFTTPRSNSAYGRRSRSAIRRETASISLAQRLVDDEAPLRPPARAARPCGRRASGRGRPRRRRDRSRAPPASAAASSSGRSPTIRIRAGSSPSSCSSRARNGPLRSLRSPRTSSLPVTTTAARGRVKRRSRPSGRDAVTTTPTRWRRRRQLPLVPVHRHAQARRVARASSQKRFAYQRCDCPGRACLRRPACPTASASRSFTYVGPVAVTISVAGTTFGFVAWPFFFGFDSVSVAALGAVRAAARGLEGRDHERRDDRDRRQGDHDDARLERAGAVASSPRPRRSGGSSSPMT